MTTRLLDICGNPFMLILRLLTTVRDIRRGKVSNLGGWTCFFSPTKATAAFFGGMYHPGASRDDLNRIPVETNCTGKSWASLGNILLPFNIMDLAHVLYQIPTRPVGWELECFSWSSPQFNPVELKASTCWFWVSRQEWITQCIRTCLCVCIMNSIEYRACCKLYNVTDVPSCMMYMYRYLCIHTLYSTLHCQSTEHVP